ncbi:MAG: signal recognition particle-docking protein FtsY [Pseudomonadota bacterium]
MIKLFKRKKKQPQAHQADNSAQQQVSTADTASIEPASKQPRLFKRLSTGLSKTRQNLFGGMSNIILGDKKIDDALLEQIETQLLIADVGINATEEIIVDLTKRVSRRSLTDSHMLLAALKENMTAMLEKVEQPLLIPDQHKPFVIFVVGVNGAGKTTTIGKLAKRLQLENKKVMLAAGDTFRAAAIEQLQVWGQRNDIAVVAQQSGADSASVIYDALSSATAQGIDVLIADTAGRLHSQEHLMAELQKIQRVMKKQGTDLPHETLLVIDSRNGQNALVQAEKFHAAIGVTGLCLTKLDGTAKGGIIFALAKKLNLPVRFIGIGESIDDLRVFNAEEFINALFEPTN